MKKMIVILACLLTSLYALACDICGAGTGSSYMGLLPAFKQKFIGIRYQYNSLRNHLGENGAATYLTAREHFHTVEFFGAVNIGSRFRVAFFMPYHFIRRETQEGKIFANGMGDITTIGYTRILSEQRETEKKMLSHSLWLGAGLKLPAGKYNPDDKNIQQAGVNTFQLGTGSTDFSLHGMYDFRINRTGLNINTSYKINTGNKFDYRYGNKLTFNALAYYRVIERKRLSMTPNAGLLYERSAKDDKTSDIVIWETGGSSLMGVTGIETSVGQWNIGANLQIPFAQYLAEGKAEAKSRSMVYLSVSF